MENKICTSIEQSKKLIELGIDVNTADMDYVPFTNNPAEYDCVINVWNNEHEEDWIPAWSLSALLELIPDKISINNESYYLSFTKKGVEFRGPITWDGQKAKTFEMDNILDAAFEMVCWLKENGKI